jgi:hypothetical protein
MLVHHITNGWRISQPTHKWLAEDISPVAEKASDYVFSPFTSRSSSLHISAVIHCLAFFSVEAAFIYHILFQKYASKIIGYSNLSVGVCDETGRSLGAFHGLVFFLLSYFFRLLSLDRFRVFFLLLALLFSSGEGGGECDSMVGSRLRGSMMDVIFRWCISVVGGGRLLRLWEQGIVLG